MSKMTIIVALIVVGLVAINLIRGYSNTRLETPDYELIKESGSFEIREYGPMIVAGTLVNSDYKEATYTGFRRIANYIFGNNSKNMDIAMTAPVISNSPVDAENKFEVIFVMPKSHTMDFLPIPNNSNVQITERDLGRVAVFSFGGWATKSRVERYHNKLKDWLEKEGYSMRGKFMVAQYNSPIST